MGHDHTHDVGTSHRGRLAVVLTITLVVMISEVVGALVSGSLALLADAGHMLTDATGLAMALFAAFMVRRPATPRRTWGYHRVEILSAAAQALLLFGVGLYVLVEGISRLLDPTPVTSSIMLIFGVVGLVGNVIGLVVLHGGKGDNLNMRAAYLEVLADTLGSVAVILAAVVIATLGWTRIDSIVSLCIGTFIVVRTLRLLRDSVDILLESTPPQVKLDEVRAHLMALPHIHDVHDLHASTIATGMPVLSAHLVVDDSCFYDGHLRSMLDDVQRCAVEDFGIEHTTFQFEGKRHADHEGGVHA
ncbi:MAG: cation transporter [Micrococcales bacterium]|nr:MAG: cation transporter [Micrococcales bacterium]